MPAHAAKTIAADITLLHPPYMHPTCLPVAPFAVKISRLYQPKNPQFWLLVLLNVLSSAISWLLHKQTLPVAAMLLLSAFALANFVLGLKIAMQLMKEPAEGANARE